MSLPERIQEEFRGTGTFHLSVSGLYAGMIAVLLGICSRLFVPQCRLPDGSFDAFLYVLMTGLKAASVRSALMAAILWLALWQTAGLSFQ
jgi:predicted membrane metal-binding protein